MSFTNPIVENPYPYAYAITANSPNTLYEAVESLVPGLYTITFSGGGTLNVDFYNGNTFIGNANGTSPILYNLGSQATNFKFWCTTSANIVISLTALALSETSGTLTTYTTNTTNSVVGAAYVILIGGGQGGQNASSSVQGGGGRSGNVYQFRANLIGGETITIGAGSGTVTYPTTMITPGDTTLGSYSSASGSPATTPFGTGQPGSNGTATTATYSFANYTTGSGGQGGSYGGVNPGFAGGSGGSGTIGTGGNGGQGGSFSSPAGQNATSPTGYGAGGGGGGAPQSGTTYGQGTAGTNGVVYIIQ